MSDLGVVLLFIVPTLESEEEAEELCREMVDWSRREIAFRGSDSKQVDVSGFVVKGVTA